METDQEPVKKEKKDKKHKKQNKEAPKETTLKDVTDIIASVAKSTGESNPNGGNLSDYLELGRGCMCLKFYFFMFLFD